MALVRHCEAAKGGPDYMIFCPGCQCGHGIWITHPNDVTKGMWTFNGNMEKPTFSPSLLVTSSKFTPLGEAQYKAMCDGERVELKDNRIDSVAVRCHMIIAEGKLHFCADSTHALAGQVVDMVDF